MTKIVLKNGSGVPEPTALEKAELALDINNGALYSKLEDGGVHQLNDFSGSGGGIPEAPTDGAIYGRQNAGWTEITNTGGGDSLWEQNGSDIYYNDGRVGIGTDNPSNAALLHLENSSSPNIIMNYPASDNGGEHRISWDSAGVDIKADMLGLKSTAYVGISVHGTQHVKVDKDGNVGIGTSPDRLLHVSGGSGSTLAAKFETASTSGSMVVFKDANTPNNDLQVRIGSEGANLVQYAGGSERMRIESDGTIKVPNSNTGTNPAANSNIAGELQFYNSSATDNNLNGIGFFNSNGSVDSRIVGVHKSHASRHGELAFLTHDGAALGERMRIDSSGRVGIGTNSPSELLSLKGSGWAGISLESSNANASVGGRIEFFKTGKTIGTSLNGTEEGLTFFTATNERMRIDPQGRVGIGGEPGTRAIDKVKALAKIKLAEWKAEVKKRTAEQPEASTQEITLEVTDGDFGVMPTEQALAEWLQGRGIGGGDAKLQVDGDGYFGGTVRADGIYSRWSSAHGIAFAEEVAGTVTVNPVRSGTNDASVDLGSSTTRWRNAHFSGTVNAGELTSSRWNSPVSGRAGLVFTSAKGVAPTDHQGNPEDGTVDLGQGGGTPYRFKDAHFSGTIYGRVDDVGDHIKAITPTDIANWNAGTGGGGGGATIDGRISDNDILNWNNAYSWGNHALAGYSKTDTTYSAGDGLSLNGNQFTMSGSYTGDLEVKSIILNNQGGFGCDAIKRILPFDENGAATDNVHDLGRDGSGGVEAKRFKDAHFAGTVNAKDVVCDRVRSGTDGRAGFQFASSSMILPVDNKGSLSDGVADLGRTANKFKDAHFSGTVSAGAFVGDGSGLTNLPTDSGPTYSAGNGISLNSNTIAMTGSYNGNFSATGTITGSDCIATSDERLKDNITTAPVGLIDELKGREWNWKESGKKGSGVVAQELEEVLPHLVHTNDQGMKSVSYMGLCGYLIEEIKALKAEVAELKNAKA